MPNIYSLMSNGQRINSNSYLRNDRDTRDTVTLSDIRMTSIRDFDTAPTAMSSTFMEKGEMIRDTILSSYSKYGSAAGTDPSLQATLDLAMSLVLNKPYEDVSRNHKAYKIVFAGRDMDDKELGRAMVDAWGSDSVANDIAMLQRRKDATNDPEEEARLEEQIQARERDLARLGDYSSVRGWFGDQLVKSSAIAPQVIEGASRSILMALVFAGLSTLITPAGAGTLLSSSVVGGSNMLGYLSTMARTAQGAAQLGAAAGTAQYLAQDVLPREYGSMSRELEQLVDESGRHMDKETRKKAAAIYALASTAIEFMTPEPGFGKLLFGVAPRQMASTSFKSWLLRVGVNMLEGGASESIEEALQDFVGSFTQDIAMNASNRTGQTDFNVQGFLDNLPGYITQAGRTLMDTFVPSMIVGIPGAISSSNLATYLANVQNEKDSLYRIPTDDSVTSATNTQRTSQRSVIVPSILVDTPTRSVREFAASIEQTDENGFGSSEKLEPVKVRFDRSRSRYVPIDEHNENLAKYINVNLKNDATVVEIVNDGSIRISNDDIENAVEISGGAMRNGVDIIFRSNDDVIAFAQSLGDSAVIERGENGSYTAVSFVDEEGNEQIRNIQINPDADIDRIVNAERQRRGFNQQRGISSSQTQGAENLGNAQGSTGRNSTAQNQGTQQSPQTSQDSVEEMSQTISTASRGNISRNESDALARLFAVLPESVRNTIFSRNNGQLVLSEEQYERMTGRRVGNRNRALSWLNRLQMVLTGRSDASSFVHELGHIVLVADPQLVDDVRLAFNLSLESREDREAVMGFVRENRNVLNNISDNRARQLLQGISNLDAKGMFSENQEEFIISMLEAHFRSDIRRSTSDSSLPSRIREVFQKVADAIRNVYGRATGNTQLPQNIQDVFNSFFWNGNTEEVRNQSMREGLEQRNEDIEIKIKKPPVFATHAPGLTPEESAAVGLFSLGASSTQNLPSSDDSVNEIRNQRALGEDAVDQGQKRFRNMDDERFKRSIEKNIFLPDYVVKAKS